MEVDVMKRIPVREQEPKVRATNFKEVCLGYDKEEATAEATRCLQCKNPQCVKGCPVNINIPGFISELVKGNVEGAYHVISEYSALPAVVAVYVHRRASVSQSASVELRVMPYLSVNLRDMSLILQEKRASNLQRLRA